MRSGRSGRLLVAVVVLVAGWCLLPGRVATAVGGAAGQPTSGPVLTGVGDESTGRVVLARVAQAVVAQAVVEQDPVEDEAPDVGDPSSTRRAYLVMAALVLLALALGAFTVWYWRSTRMEPPALGRLEAMSQRRWYHADYMTKRTQLDEAHEFVGGDGPILPPAERAAVASGLVAAEGDTDTDVDALESPAVAKLAELVEATPEPPVAEVTGSIGDPEVLKALGLDDESLGLVPAAGSVGAVLAAAPVDDDDDDDDDDFSVGGSAGAAESTRPAMDPLFDIGDDWSEGIEAPPPVWGAEEELSEDEIHEREATGEFVRLVQRSAPGDGPQPEQQRFSLPGEPLV